MKKKWLTSKQFAAKQWLSVAQVNRLAREGRLDARKEKGRWAINPDSKMQSRKVPPEIFYSDGKRLKFPPENPRPGSNLIYDMEKECFVPVEKYAKEHGYRVVVQGRRKLIDVNSIIEKHQQQHQK